MAPAEPSSNKARKAPTQKQIERESRRKEKKREKRKVKRREERLERHAAAEAARSRGDRPPRPCSHCGDDSHWNEDCPVKEEHKNEIRLRSQRRQYMQGKAARDARTSGSHAATTDPQESPLGRSAPAEPAHAMFHKFLQPSSDKPFRHQILDAFVLLAHELDTGRAAKKDVELWDAVVKLQLLVSEQAAERSFWQHMLLVDGE